jgi:predicted small lipoprotein YifL
MIIRVRGLGEMRVVLRFITILLMVVTVAGCSGKPAPAPAVAPLATPTDAAAPSAGSALQLAVSDLRDTGVPGLFIGLDPDGHYFVASGPEPDYWLNLTRLGAPDHPEVVAKVRTASAAVVQPSDDGPWTGGVPARQRPDRL